MSPIEYIVAAFDWWPVYVGLLTASAIFYFSLTRRVTLGIFDPLFLALLSDAFGWALVSMMYLRGDIPGKYFFSFAICQAFFCLGILTRHALRYRWTLQPVSGRYQGQAISVFCVAWGVHVLSTLVTWSLVGIPILRDSRIGAFYGSGGLGIIERFSTASSEIAIFSALYLFFSRRGERRPAVILYPFLLWFFCFLALSGAKSALLGLGQAAFAGYICFGQAKNPRALFWGGRVGIKFFLLCLVFAILVIAFRAEDGLAGSLAGLVFRLISYADIYIYAYPTGLIEKLQGDNALVGMFGGLLSTFRLFPVDMIHENLGLQFTRMVFPDLAYIAGPNPRQAVFGYHYFGDFAFAFSFAIGFVTMTLHHRLYFGKQGDGFLTRLLIYQLFFAAVSMNTDFSYAMSKIATIIFGAVIVLLPATILSRAALQKRLAYG